MLSILNLTKTNKLVLAAFAFVAVLAFGSGRAHAATLNVTGGCTLPIAINSVNAAANQSGCTATGASYGTSDTITIPAGTVTLAADLPLLTESVEIHGAGMSQTTINGNAWKVFETGMASGSVTVTDLKVTASKATAIQLVNCDVVLENIEVDGTGQTGNANGIIIFSSNSASLDVSAENIYIHSLTGTNGQYAEGFSVGSRAGGHYDVNINNITLANVHNTLAGVNGIILSAGYPGNGGGTITSVISNATIHDITSSLIVAPFATFAAATNGDSTATTNINNITVTGVRGFAGSGITAGLNTAAFYAAGLAGGPSDEANVSITVSNSLMADNLNNGVSSNCSYGDMSGNVGGVGTVNSIITSAGYNISDDASCAGFNQPGDQQNVNNIISTLGPLQNNGGAVPTRALLPGSPAISAGGSVLGITTDARGVARPDECPSVGAYQYEGAVCGASTPSASGGSNAGAPNTGVGSVAQILNVLASMLGIGLLTYVFHKQQRSS